MTGQGGFREKLTDTDNAQTLMAKDCGQRLEEVPEKSGSFS